MGKRKGDHEKEIANIIKEVVYCFKFCIFVV